VGSKPLLQIVATARIYILNQSKAYREIHGRTSNVTAATPVIL